MSLDVHKTDRYQKCFDTSLDALNPLSQNMAHLFGNINAPREGQTFLYSMTLNCAQFRIIGVNTRDIVNESLPCLTSNALIFDKVPLPELTDILADEMILLSKI